MHLKIPDTFVLHVKARYLLLHESFVDGLLCKSFAGSLVVSTYQFSHYILSSLPGMGKHRCCNWLYKSYSCEKVRAIFLYFSI